MNNIVKIKNFDPVIEKYIASHDKNTKFTKTKLLYTVYLYSIICIMNNVVKLNNLDPIIERYLSSVINHQLKRLSI